MKKKKVFLHIGTHKTGSTTIQHVLKSNSNILKKNRFRVLGSSFLYEIFREEAYNESLVKSCRKIIKLKTKRFFRDYNYIVSNETLSGNPWIGYSNSNVTAQMLAEIFKDFDVKIIIYLRRQDIFIESIYKQYVHEGGTLSFDEYIVSLKLGRDFDWENLIDSFCKNFSEKNMIVRVFEKDRFSNGNLVDDFVGILGLDFIKDHSVEHKNIGYSRDVLEVARNVNKYLDENQRKLLRLELQKVSEVIESPNYLFFDEQHRKLILDRYEKSNKSLAARYFEGGDQQLFSSKVPEAEKYSGLTNQALSQVLIMIVLNINSRKDDLYALSFIRNIEIRTRRLVRFFTKLPKSIIIRVLLGGR